MLVTNHEIRVVTGDIFPVLSQNYLQPSFRESPIQYKYRSILYRPYRLRHRLRPHILWYLLNHRQTPPAFERSCGITPGANSEPFIILSFVVSLFFRKAATEGTIERNIIIRTTRQDTIYEIPLYPEPSVRDYPLS